MGMGMGLDMGMGMGMGMVVFFSFARLGQRIQLRVSSNPILHAEADAAH